MTEKQEFRIGDVVETSQGIGRVYQTNDDRTWAVYPADFGAILWCPTDEVKLLDRPGIDLPEGTLLAVQAWCKCLTCVGSGDLIAAGGSYKVPCPVCAGVGNHWLESGLITFQLGSALVELDRKVSLMNMPDYPSHWATKFRISLVPKQSV